MAAISAPLVPVSLPFKLSCDKKRTVSCNEFLLITLSTIHIDWLLVAVEKRSNKTNNDFIVGFKLIHEAVISIN